MPDHHQRQTAPDPIIRATVPAASTREAPPAEPLPSVRAFCAANLAVVLGHLLLAELANQPMPPSPPTREPDEHH